MLVRTFREALDVPAPFASWKQNVIEHVKMGGVALYRVTVFDSSLHRCKRCVGGSGLRGESTRVACTGQRCKRCGNPFGAFIRLQKVQRGGKWSAIPSCWASTGSMT